MLTRILRRLALELAVLQESTRNSLAQRTLPRFADAPSGAEIQLPRQFSNPQLIHLGDNVKLGPNSVLRALTKGPGSWLEHPEGEHISQTFKPELRIGDRVTATGALQVVAHEKIIIEDDVMFANNVFICDGLHGFERGDIPYKYQGIFRIKPIRIGRGSWLGQNVVVMPGVTIGELCVIGANSVVNKDIPDNCVAAGSPAKLIRRWDSQSEAWKAVTDAKTRLSPSASLAAK